jgi:hypothetical protein
MRDHTTNQDVGLDEGCDPVFIIKAERGDGENQTLSFYCTEPELIHSMSGEREYAGGFSEISNVIVFETGSEARTARNRLAKIYRDLPVEMVVLRVTRKEIFQARLK